MITGGPSPFDDPRQLDEHSRHAVGEAIAGSLARGIPVVYREGGEIVREHPDGAREICHPADQTLVACLPALGWFELAAGVPLEPLTPGKKIMRVFAGPNGSGKSTIFEYIAKRYESGKFINADYIAAALRRDGRFSLAGFGLSATEDDVRAALQSSSWGWEESGNAEIASMIVEPGPEIRVKTGRPDHSAAIVADIARQLMMKEGRHFSVETVMSHPSKLELIWEARRLGYTCYLYYICTDSPAINVERVRTRVSLGGHDVPAANIAARYHRSLLLLRPAINLSYRAFLFDNSERVSNPGSDAGGLLRLEYKEGSPLQLFRGAVPGWISKHALGAESPSEAGR